MKKFSSLFKILKAVLIVAVAVLLVRSVYNGVRYSRWSSLPAAQVLSESGGRYEEFLSFAEDRSDGAHETFLNLCGKLDWKQLSLSGSESVAFTCDSLLGTVRLLIVDSASGRVVHDDLIGSAQEIPMEAGSYQIYLLGNWFTGSVEIQHKGGSAL